LVKAGRSWPKLAEVEISFDLLFLLCLKNQPAVRALGISCSAFRRQTSDVRRWMSDIGLLILEALTVWLGLWRQRKFFFLCKCTGGRNEQKGCCRISFVVVGVGGGVVGVGDGVAVVATLGSSAHDHAPAARSDGHGRLAAADSGSCCNGYGAGAGPAHSYGSAAHDHLPADGPDSDGYAYVCDHGRADNGVYPFGIIGC